MSGPMLSGALDAMLDLIYNFCVGRDAQFLIAYLGQAGSDEVCAARWCATNKSHRQRVERGAGPHGRRLFGVRAHDGRGDTR